MHDNDVVLGIDIGGTKTSFGFVDRKGIINGINTIATQASDSAETFVSRLHHSIEEFRRNLTFHHRLLGIGIGAPNANYNRGTIEKAVNLAWEDTVDFVALIRRHYDLPVSITNDAGAAALGEMIFGGARGMKHFIVITLGTGLGSGIIVNGRLLHGASGFAGELGHVTVDPSGRRCACGKQGCLEAYVSATGIRRTAMIILARQNIASKMRVLKCSQITSKRIYELALSGDAVALEAFDYTARILGWKLADAVAHTSPETIFLTGGLSRAGDLLLKPTQHYMDEFLFRIFKGTVKLMLSELKPDNGAILGAAALIWSDLAASGETKIY